MAGRSILSKKNSLITTWYHQKLLDSKYYKFRMNNIDFIKQISMKIAFKYNSAVKIYSKELKMDHIKGFIKHQFSLEPETYTLTFQDSENDIITIASNQDLVALSEIEHGQKLLKIIINLKEATQIIVLKEEQLQQSKTQEIIQTPIQVAKKVEKVEQPVEDKNNSQNKRGCQKGRWQKWQGKGNRGQCSREQSNKKPQISSSSEKDTFQTQDQKRFEQFLGQHIAKFTQKIGPKLYKFFNKLNKPHRKHQHRGRFPYILANIFGGQAETFKEFVNNNKDLGKQQIIKKYAQQKGIKQNDLKVLTVNFKCRKLGQWFATTPESFKEFVEGNIDLPPKVLRDMQIQKGLQLKQKQYHNKEEKKSEKKTKDNRSKSKGDKKRDSSAQREEKGNILKSLIDLFGSKNIKKYYKLIEKHFSEGEQAIVSRWLEHHQKSSA